MTDYDRSFRTIDTNVVHAGAPQPNIGGTVVTPLFQSANYVMSGETTYDALTSIRLSNSPSHLTLQARLATIESGEAALVTASGMAAITTSIAKGSKDGIRRRQGVRDPPSAPGSAPPEAPA